MALALTAAPATTSSPFRLPVAFDGTLAEALWVRAAPAPIEIAARGAPLPLATFAVLTSSAAQQPSLELRLQTGIAASASTAVGGISVALDANKRIVGP